ncbi:GMC oxidoreductase [Xylariales sp. AK1849]|nr:GMC oxidoreductase [Xylariales sp. AK1849]
MVATHHLANPISTPLPPLVFEHCFNETQWRVLFALVDAALPPIVAEHNVTEKRDQLRISQRQYEDAYASVLATMTHPPELERFKEYLRTKQSDSPRVVRNVKRTFETVPEKSRKELGLVLDLLNTRVGSFFLTGYCTPFLELPLHIRHAVFHSWTTSWIPVFPILAKTVLSLSQKAFSQADPLYQQLLGYTDSPVDYRPGPEFDFQFMQFDANEEPAIIETDVVIVGSGCGGAVCAKVLAEAGHQVLVVDKGYYFPPSQLPMDQESGCRYLFEGQGIMLGDDNSFNVLAATCWGGGGTVNWSVSLQPQEFVRREWADQGLPFFVTEEYQECLDRVCGVMGVSDAHVRHNHGGQVIIDGSRKLGWNAKTAPQNTGTEDHYCGRCHFGCGTAGKKGPAVSWLPAASEAGAKFIEGFRVSELLFDDASGTRKAIGLVGRWTARDKEGKISSPEASRVQRTIRVKAKKVIVAAGSLQSPLLLLRSGLKSPHIGRNLHLHPCNYVVGRFDEDIQPWEGSSITSLCSEFEDLDGKGHGVKLETLNMLPYITLSTMPWYSGLEYKLNALKFRNMNGYISLARDRDTGRVYPDPISGAPRVDYTASAFDRAHILTGVVALAKLCYVEGAREIFAFLPGTRPFVRGESTKLDNDINDPDFVAWLRSIEKAGNKPPITPFGSAHQMGTCRMSSNERSGVVDPKGKTWEAEDLYVADSSVFPSASGVNPMITVMATADYIARGIAKELSGSN